MITANRIFTFISVFIIGVALWRATDKVSPDAIGMALGVLFGILAGVPVALLVIAGTRRQPEPAPARHVQVFPCPDCGEDLYWKDGQWVRHDCAFEDELTYDMPPGCYPSGAPQCPDCGRPYTKSSVGWRHTCPRGGDRYLGYHAVPVRSECGMKFELTEDGDWYHAHKAYGDRPGKRFVTVPGSGKKRNVVGVVVIQQRPA